MEQVYSAELWQEVFGVRCEPFADGIVGPLLNIAQRQDNLDNLRHLGHFSDQIIMLTGEQGAGKSLLLDELVKLESEVLNIVFMQAPSHSLQMFMGQLAVSLSVPHIVDEPVEGLVSKIKIMCRQKFEQGVRTLFVIDDLQDISDEGLAFLVKNLRPEKSGAFGLLLAGCPQIVSRIRDTFQIENDQDSFHQIQLKPLTKQETEQYVEYRLVNAGWKGKPKLSPELIDSLHKLGQGTPGRINRMSVSVLLADSVNKSDYKLGMLGRSAAIGLVSGLVVLIFVAFYVLSRQGDDASSKHVTSDRVLHQIPINQPIEDVNITDETDVFRSDDLTFIESQDQASSDPSLDISAINNSRAVDDADLIPEVPSGIQATAAESDNNTEELKSQLKENTPDTGLSQQTAKPELPSTAAKQSQPEEKQPKLIIEKSLSDTQTSIGEGAFRSNEWLSEQPRTQWTIQVLGSLYRKSAESFISKQRSEEYFYLRSSYKGKDWFVVLHGAYSSQNEAKVALQSLPESIRRQGAWPRSLASLKKDVGSL